MRTDVYTKVVDYSDYAKQARMPKDYSEIYTATKRFCFTHSEDFDGVFAGEIVRKFFGGKIKVVPVNYGEAGYATVLEDYDLKNADIVITDFSFDEKTMMKMAEVCRTVTWCDHHKSAIDKMKPLGFSKLDNVYGLQTEKWSGAELAWAWFYNKMQCKDMSDEPDIVRMVGEYDTWRFRKSDKDELVALQNGMKASGVTFESEHFDWLLYELEDTEGRTYEAVSAYQSEMTEMLQKGYAVGEYQRNYLFKDYAKFAYDVKVKVGGRTLTGCALNVPDYSDAFMYCYDKSKHDFCVKFHKKGEMWNYSVYIMDDKKGKVSAIDVAKTIAPGNAGGHPGAAGAHTKVLVKEIREAVNA